MTTLSQLLTERVKRQVEGALIIAGQVVASEARRSIQQSPRGGRVYHKIQPIRTHKASAPFESPANDLGFLVRSIQVEPELQNLRVRIVQMHSIAPYGKRLEYGDLSARLQPRPFMYKAFHIKRHEASLIINNALNAAIASMAGVQP